MSNVPVPLPDGLDQVDEAASVVASNPQGEKALPTGGQPEVEAPTGPPAMPKLTPGKQRDLPPLGGPDAMLFGPTTRPAEPATFGGGLLAKPQPPDNLGKYVPALKLAVADPDAPPLLHNIYQLLAYHTGE